MKDLFKNPPKETHKAIDKFNSSEGTYQECEELETELNQLGYSCEFGLDAVPYNLRKL